MALFRQATLICASLMLLAGSPAVAQGEVAPGSACFIAGEGKAGIAALADRPDRWTCNKDKWSISSERSILRFDLHEQPGNQTTFFSTRLTMFDTLRLTVIGGTGSRATKLLVPDDMERSTHDWVMSGSLPEIDEKPATLYVEITKPRHLGMLTDAAVGNVQDAEPTGLRLELILAAMCGLLIMPFIYNIAFYRVLRERFLLWHAAFVASMFTHTLVGSGLINRFTEIPFERLIMLQSFSWSAGIVAGGLFIIEMIEPGRLDPRHKQIARWLAPWIFAWTGFYVMADGIFRPWATPLYHLSLLPVLALFSWIMIYALRRRSRAIIFQVSAWLPVMIVGGVRVVTASGLFSVPVELMFARHVAIVIGVVVTSLSVADRFVGIKRQRDRALAQTRRLEHKVEHDALTGLLNRRAISERFPDLHAQGFDTMAVLDLDHFKLVNDTHGHAVGDEVLRSVAIALMPDDDTLVVRMGGEEFLLFLRGKNTTERAERRRLAITTRIANKVPGLDRPVTASMGLVEQPVGSRMHANFISLYSHCDRLLYEAKRTGRNRTMSEKVVRFDNRADIEQRATG